MQIIDGKKISEGILFEIKEKVSALPERPLFVDFLIGDDIVSRQYVRIKQKTAEKAGMDFEGVFLPENVDTDEAVAKIREYNGVKRVCGIIVQLPLPTHIDTRAVLNAIDPALDVDVLGSAASKAFYANQSKMSPPTALACMRILGEMDIDLSGANVAVLGAGELVGKPVSAMLDRKGVKHELLDSKSPNRAEVLRNADLIISGIGVEGYIKGDMIKSGASIIDAGTSESGGSVVGDADFDSVGDRARYITPVPGGVGPVTVAMLLSNVLQVAQSKL